MFNIDNELNIDEFFKSMNFNPSSFDEASFEIKDQQNVKTLADSILANAEKQWTAEDLTSFANQDNLLD